MWNGWHIFATGCKRLKLGLTRLMLTHPAVEKWRLVKLRVSPDTETDTDRDSKICETDTDRSSKISETQTDIFFVEQTSKWLVNLCLSQLSKLGGK